MLRTAPFLLLGLGRMFSRRLEAWLLPGFLGVLAVIGLALLYSELRNAARLRKKKRRELEELLVIFPDRKDHRKAS